MIELERRGQLGVLIGLLGRELDIPDDMDRVLNDAYRALSTFFQEHAPEGSAWEIYPQGSKRIGTIVRPVSDQADYDLDMVLRHDVLRTSTTQTQLKQSVEQQLRAFIKTLSGRVPKLTEGSRCWKLTYPGFHVDVLPAIPNDSHTPEHSILITDRDVRSWQPSNPRGYARWFASRSTQSFIEERKRLAKSREVKVESIPDHDVKTPLQRGVQLLKRHRDLCFARKTDGDDKPASIIITTLAALAYEHRESPLDSIEHMFTHFVDGVENRDGVFWVPNPIDHGENFADRWKAHPERARAFYHWAESASADFRSMTSAVGLDALTKSMGAAFGGDAATRVAVKLGERARRQRERGKLKISKGGTLGSSGRVVKDHTFFGS